MPQIPPDHEKPENSECECCEHPADLDWYPKSRQMGWKGPAGYWLCRLCSGTHASNVVLEYRDQHDNDTALAMQAICHVGNAILSEIRAVGLQLEYQIKQQ